MRFREQGRQYTLVDELSTPPSDAWVLGQRRAIGQQIRSARLHANLTQEKLAERAGIDRQAVNRVEQGHQSPLVDNLLRIAYALDVPLADLVREEPAAGTGD